MEDSCDLSSLPIMPTQFFWSIGFSSFYTLITARCYCAHFVLLFLPVVLASLVALVVPATPAFLAVLKRSKPCLQGTIRHCQVHSVAIRRALERSTSSVVQPSTSTMTATTARLFYGTGDVYLTICRGGGRLTSSVGEIIRHAPLSKG